MLFTLYRDLCFESIHSVQMCHQFDCFIVNLPLISGTEKHKSWKSIFTAGQCGKYFKLRVSSFFTWSLSTLISSEEYCIFDKYERSIESVEALNKKKKSQFLKSHSMVIRTFFTAILLFFSFYSILLHLVCLFPSYDMKETNLDKYKIKIISDHFNFCSNQQYGRF